MKKMKADLQLCASVAEISRLEADNVSKKKEASKKFLKETAPSIVTKLDTNGGKVDHIYTN